MAQPDPAPRSFAPDFRLSGHVAENFPLSLNRDRRGNPCICPAGHEVERLWGTRGLVLSVHRCALPLGLQY